jgi:hypothetical protein
VVPDHEVIRSSRIGDAMARDSPGERRSAKPPVGFNSRRVSIGPWSSGQGGSLLRSKRAFESRRAGPWCSRYRRRDGEPGGGTTAVRDKFAEVTPGSPSCGQDYDVTFE